MNDEYNEYDEYMDGLLAQMFLQAEAQFGDAVKSYWFYDGDACPGCGLPIDTLQIEGKEALSLNAFIYRERGVLIGYLLCGRCAQKIIRDTDRDSRQQRTIHAAIESNLIKGYKRYLRSMDA